MSEKFTASNGVDVETDVHGCVTVTGLNSLRDESQALREFFLHERDQDLGRWRWPEDLNYVVYRDGTSRRVVCESTGQTMQVSQHDRKVMTTYLESYVGAAKAYDAAHPPPKPAWHDAKPGEVWAITMGDAPAFPVATIAALFGVRFQTTGVDPVIVDPESTSITDARLIWPEAVES